ncbi:hypothetical protein IEQ34_002517 [Dendrobium chrysotoxum]|uniref:Uncharacterized protein n=1 Tax=Dendrobium chrysotoxum TaxID=161865 RepID=A0AAV7HMB5_DENCH|nr:hypothetical protein IEQ34_002517 [Dendrobium chrysotoxum]
MSTRDRTKLSSLNGLVTVLQSRGFFSFLSSKFLSDRSCDWRSLNREKTKLPEPARGRRWLRNSDARKDTDSVPTTAGS